MGKLHFDLSMSLDGFVTGPGEGVANPLGDGGERLHDWMFAAKTDADAKLVDELYATTGALLIGKRNFDRPGLVLRRQPRDVGRSLGQQHVGANGLNILSSASSSAPPHDEAQGAAH